jgi:hypothetical protein
LPVKTSIVRAEELVRARVLAWVEVELQKGTLVGAQGVMITGDQDGGAARLRRAGVPTGDRVAGRLAVVPALVNGGL